MADVRHATRTPPTPTAPVAVEAEGRLRTPRLILRPLAEADRPGFLALVESNHARLEGRIPLAEPGESDDAFFTRQLEACRTGDTGRGSFRRVAELIETGTPTLVGCFNLNSIQRGLAWEADAAWWVGSAFAGRGLATEGVNAILAHAFNAMPAGLGLHGVHCGIEATNTASVRVAEKTGFEHRPGARSYLKVGEQWVMHEFYMATPESLGRRTA